MNNLDNGPRLILPANPNPGAPHQHVTPAIMSAGEAARTFGEDFVIQARPGFPARFRKRARPRLRHYDPAARVDPFGQAKAILDTAEKEQAYRERLLERTRTRTYFGEAAERAIAGGCGKRTHESYLQNEDGTIAMRVVRLPKAGLVFRHGPAHMIASATVAKRDRKAQEAAKRAGRARAVFAAVARAVRNAPAPVEIDVADASGFEPGDRVEVK